MSRTITGITRALRRRGLLGAALAAPDGDEAVALAELADRGVRQLLHAADRVFAGTTLSGDMRPFIDACLVTGAGAM